MGIHFEKAYFARGIENFLVDMAGKPEFTKALLDIYTECCCKGFDHDEWEVNYR